VKYNNITEALSRMETKIDTAAKGLNQNLGRKVQEKTKALGDGIGMKLDEKFGKLDEKIGKLDEKMDTRFGNKETKLEIMGTKHSFESKELNEMTQFYSVCSELSLTGEAANLSSGPKREPEGCVCLCSCHLYSGMIAMSCIIYRMF